MQDMQEMQDTDKTDKKEIMFYYRTSDNKNYDIKILDEITVRFEGKGGIFTNRMLLAKKQTEKKWRLLFIQLNNTNCDERELVYPINTIIIDDEKKDIKCINPRPDDEDLIKICKELMKYNGLIGRRK